MTGAKMVLVTGIVSQVAVLPGEGLIDIYKTAGIVGVLLVLLAVVYLDGRKRQEKTETLLQANADAAVKQAEAMAKHAAATDKQADAVFQMSQIIRTCAIHRGVAPVQTVPEVNNPHGA